MKVGGKVTGKLGGKARGGEVRGTLGRGPLLRKTGKGSRPSLFSCNSRISTVSSSRK